LLAEGEVILEGRRYRLVPLDPDAHASASAARSLTARELQIAALVAEGMVNKQIAAELQISEWTVSTHLRRMFAKLGVDTRAAMVSRCMAVLSR
jgi:DNA-binding CsgD family transcriptional regulator